MVGSSRLTWPGARPAATTQFVLDLPIDTDATQQAQMALAEHGADRLIPLGMVGENNSLTKATSLPLLHRDGRNMCRHTPNAEQGGGAMRSDGSMA